MDPNSRMRVKLTGEQFNGGRLPVSALPELINMQDLLNADGSDIPENELLLVIEDIQDGSAEILLSVVTAASIALAPGMIEDREKYLHQTLQSALASEDRPYEGLNDRQATALSKLGETLGEGQTIEVHFDNPSFSPISIDVIQARRLAETFTVRDLLVSEELDVDQESNKAQPAERFRLLGKITAIDAERKKFSFATDNHGVIKNGHYEGHAILEDLRKALDETSTAESVALTCQAQTKAGKLWRISEVIEVNNFGFHSTEYGERLKSFFELHDGWGENEDGQEIAVDIIHAAEAFAQKWVELTGVTPSSFPMESGGVLLEREVDGKMLSIELNPDSSYYLHQLDFATHQESDLETSNQQVALQFMRMVLS